MSKVISFSTSIIVWPEMEATASVRLAGAGDGVFFVVVQMLINSIKGSNSSVIIREARLRR